MWEAGGGKRPEDIHGITTRRACERVDVRSEGREREKEKEIRDRERSGGE